MNYFTIKLPLRVTFQSIRSAPTIFVPTNLFPLLTAIKHPSMVSGNNPLEKRIMAAKKSSSKRIVLRTGEALVEGDLDYLCAEPEIVIGEMDGPVGIAFASLLGNQIKGHT